MLILLPPSESKTQPEHGVPVDLADLGFPELTEARELMLDRLAEVSRGDDALELLKAGPSLEAEVRRNALLQDIPAAPALQVYSGVLYDALDYAGLDPAARERARGSLLVVSALWGAVGPGDRIPAYRLSMGARITPKGTLGAWWKGELTPVLDARARGELVIDCRSGAYQAAWKAPADRTVEIRAERVRPDGGRAVVSHMAKHYRGLVARILLERGEDPQDASQLKELLGADLEVELAPAADRKPAQLTVVVREEG